MKAFDAAASNRLFHRLQAEGLLPEAEAGALAHALLDIGEAVAKI